METGLVVGLAAALAWGLSSYIGAVAARQFGGWITNIGSSLASLAVLLPVGLVALADRPAAPSPADVALLASVGIGVLAIDFVLYSLLTMAPVAVIYPILASNSAVVTVLAVALLGERLSTAQTAGVVLVTVGIFLIAWKRAPGEAPIAGLAQEALSGASLLAGPRRSGGPAPREASLSVLAAAVAITVAAGVLLFVVADASRRLGWYQPVIIDRTAQALVIGALLAAGLPPRAHLRGHASRWWLLLGCMGLLNAAASSFYGFGLQHGSTALTATAASTFAAVPVILGIGLLGERPGRHQLVGIVAAIVGIVALAG